MSDFILIDGDKANFNPTFGMAIVEVKEGALKASGKSTLKGQKVCLDGDEKNLQRVAGLRGVAIYLPLFVIGRIAHTISYLKALQPWRNLSYQLGLWATFAMAGHIVWQSTLTAN